MIIFKICIQLFLKSFNSNESCIGYVLCIITEFRRVMIIFSIMHHVILKISYFSCRAVIYYSISISSRVLYSSWLLKKYNVSVSEISYIMKPPKNKKLVYHILLPFHKYVCLAWDVFILQVLIYTSVVKCSSEIIILFHIMNSLQMWTNKVNKCASCWTCVMKVQVRSVRK